MTKSSRLVHNFNGRPETRADTLRSTFERFAENARQVVVLARGEAQALGRAEIDTDHLLLGLLQVENGLAARVLEELGVELHTVREQVERGDAASTGQMPFTPRAKKVLELSLREALSIGHNYIGTEHILLGLVRENEGPANAFLPDPETVRDAVIAKLGAMHAVERSRGSFGSRRAWFGMRSTRQQWQYRVEERETVDEEWLNELGADGWMLAGVAGARLIFQRPCDPPGEVRASA